MSENLALKNTIRAHIVCRRNNEKRQGQLLDENEDFHETIRIKLDGLNDTPQFWNFCRCGNEQIFRTCKGCGTVEAFTYRCNIKWCPRCQWRVTDTRRKVLSLWTSKIAQPKHLVLTQKNFPVLTRSLIRKHTRALARLRRRASFKEVRGGCVSVEVTNEGSGWHLHSHWLLDCRWLDMPSLSRDWASLVGQDFAICKVMDCREKNYLQEVTKYVVEGSELAKWPAAHVNEFTRAIRGLRFFFSFGSLHKLAPEIRRELAALRPPGVVCDCGSCDFNYEDEPTAACREAKQLGKKR